MVMPKHLRSALILFVLVFSSVMLGNPDWALGKSGGQGGGGSVPGCKNAGAQAHNPHCGAATPDVILAPGAIETPQPEQTSNQLPETAIPQTPETVSSNNRPKELGKKGPGKKGPSTEPPQEPGVSVVQQPQPDPQPPAGKPPGQKGKKGPGKRGPSTEQGVLVERPKPLLINKPSTGVIVSVASSQKPARNSSRYITRYSGRQDPHRPAYFKDPSTETRVECVASGHQKRKHISDDGEVTYSGAHLASVMADPVLTDVPAWHDISPDCVIYIREESSLVDDE